MKTQLLYISFCAFLLLARDPASAKDISIKEKNHANIDVEFNKIFPTKNVPNKYVYYDTDYRKQGCFITCDQTDGLLIKWSSFFLQIQPYERYCPFVTCRSRYPSPPSLITISTSNGERELKIFDQKNNIYYLPLGVRSSIPFAKSLLITVPGAGLSIYKPSPSALEDIKKVVDMTEELPNQQQLSEKSIEDRLSEARSLLESELISEEEYSSMRRAILGIQE